jgi:tRNA G10  N-methylase Trm11
MHKYIFFLGHQPHLSVAELQAVFGAGSILDIANQYAILELNQEPNIDLLGGTTKISRLIKSESLEQDYKLQIKNLVLAQITEHKSDKLKLGLSIYSGKYDTQLSRKFIQKTLEELRSELKNSLKLRTIEPKDTKTTQLNAAQIIHGDLLKKDGLSLDIIITKSTILLAQTFQVPNLKKYTLRDYGKPKPSGVNGMLPPKLAQILINLSGAKPGDTILDPFCGSGTVLQEALLMDISGLGTDLNPQIIDDAKKNLEWLDKRFQLRDSKAKFDLEVADATTHQWSKSFTHIVCEGYLGTALSKEPSPAKLQEIITSCNNVAEGFFKNIHSQLNKDQKIVVALPCWFIGKEIIKLPVVENLPALGYNLMKSKKVSEDSSEDAKSDLIYHRSTDTKSQLVGRDIYVLTKK